MKNPWYASPVSMNRFMHKPNILWGRPTDKEPEPITNAERKRRRTKRKQTKKSQRRNRL